MKACLKVIKTDGSCEEYLHTKVMYTISRALACAGQCDMAIAENLSDVVTYFLYKKHGEAAISSSEILSVVKITLTSTGYETAAEALTDHHYRRKIKRSRIELVHINLDSDDALDVYGDDSESEKSRWDKSVIAQDLVVNRGVDRNCARMVAGMVEEKIFNLGLTAVPVGLMKQLVYSDTAAVLRAQKQLQTA
jgi:hypothetical protein